MAKWEYKVIYYAHTPFDKERDDVTMKETLNHYGKDGWELVQVEYKNADGWIYFKRKVKKSNNKINRKK